MIRAADRSPPEVGRPPSSFSTQSDWPGFGAASGPLRATAPVSRPVVDRELRTYAQRALGVEIDTFGRDRHNRMQIRLLVVIDHRREVAAVPCIDGAQPQTIGIHGHITSLVPSQQCTRTEVCAGIRANPSARTCTLPCKNASTLAIVSKCNLCLQLTNAVTSPRKRVEWRIEYSGVCTAPCTMRVIATGRHARLSEAPSVASGTSSECGSPSSRSHRQFIHSFTTQQQGNGHTKHKIFTPRTHHTRFIQMLADV